MDSLADRVPAGHVVLVGLPGTGKSTVGAGLARRLGRHSVDTDRLVEQRCGATVEECFSRDGEAAFREVESAALADVLAGEPSVVATGGGAVLDVGNRRLMGDRATVVWLTAAPEELVARLERSAERRPLLREDPRHALERLAAERGSLYTEVADVVVDTSGRTPTAVLDAVVEALVASVDEVSETEMRT